jgi:hypothetical protein
VDDYGLTTVELQSVGYKDDQWVLASDVAQVAYYVMPEDNRKHVVVSGKQRIVGADGVESPEEYNNYAELRLLPIIQRRSRMSRTAATSPRSFPGPTPTVRRGPS